MTEAILASNKRGTSLRVPGAPSLPPPSPEKSSLLVANLNQLSPPMTDAALNNHGTPTGGIEFGVTGITTGSIRCVAGDGASCAIIFPNIIQYQEDSNGNPLTQLGVSGYAQPDTFPVVGDRMTLAAKDGGGVPGGWRVELYNDGGTGRLRGSVKDLSGTIRWAGGSTGTGTISLATAFCWGLTYDGSVVRLWLNNLGAIGTSETFTTNFGANDLPIVILNNNNNTAPFDGPFDDFVVRNFAFTQTEFQSLDAPVTIDHGGVTPPPPAEFSCLARTSGTLNTTHKDLGAVTTTRSLTIGGDARVDGTGTRVNVSHVNAAWTPNPAWRVYSNAGGVNGACMTGGAVHTTNLTLTSRWGSIYPNGVHTLMEFRAQNGPLENMLVEGFRVHGCFDGIGFFRNQGSGGWESSNCTVRGGWWSLVRDDWFENDRYQPHTIVDNLVDGCMTYYSSRNTGISQNMNHRLVTHDRQLIRMERSHLGGTQFGDVMGWVRVLKVFSNSPTQRFINCVLMTDHPSVAGNGDPLGDFKNTSWPYDRTGSSGNLFVWAGQAQYGSYAANWGSPPPGWQVTATLSEWTGRVSAWKTNHPSVQRIPGVD